MDSHCEANKDWAEPLLQRIKQDYKTVVTPVIDLIDDTTFAVRLDVPAMLRCAVPACPLGSGQAPVCKKACRSL